LSLPPTHWDYRHVPPYLPFIFTLLSLVYLIFF
jgi:hypothetical protein